MTAVALHATQAAGRWFQLSLVEQMANIGTEVARALRAKSAGNRPRFDNALDRALELFDLSLADSRWTNARRREVARAREVTCDFLVGDNDYESTAESIDRYFLPYAVAARGTPRPPLRRFMLDTNAIDAIADDQDLLHATVRQVANGRIALLVSHVQVDELAAIPDAKADRRAQLRSILAALRPEWTTTAGFVLDVSRLDQATLFSDEGASRHRVFTGGNPAHNQDGLLLATAEREHIPVVTAERRVGRWRQFFPLVEILSIAEYEAVLTALG